MILRHLNRFFGQISALSFHSLQWSLVGGIISSGVLFSLGIIAGRILGPKEFGGVGLVQTIAMIISTFMVAGLDVAVIHYAAKHQEKREVQKIVSSSFLNALVFMVVMTVVVILFTNRIADYLSVNRAVVYGGTAFALAVSVKVLTDGIMRSVGDFRVQAYNKVVESVVALGLFLVILSQTRGYEAYIWALTGAALLYAALSLFRVRSYYRVSSASFVVTKQLATYGFTALISTIFGLAFLYLDKIIIQLALGQQVLGLYMAYYTAAIMPISQLSGMVANVFYPIAAKSSDPAHILTFLHNSCRRFIIPVIIVIGLSGMVVMKLFGSQYVYEPATLLLFSVWGGILFFASFYNYVIMGHSQKLFMIGLRFQLVKTALFGLYLFILLQLGLLSIIGIVFGLIFANIVEIINCTLVLRLYGNKSLYA